MMDCIEPEISAVSTKGERNTTTAGLKTDRHSVLQALHITSKKHCSE